MTFFLFKLVLKDNLFKNIITKFVHLSKFWKKKLYNFNAKTNIENKNIILYTQKIVNTTTFWQWSENIVVPFGLVK